MNNRKRTIRNDGGFTLVEILLATIIGMLVVVVAFASFRNVTRNRQMLEYYAKVMGHGRYAINQIRDDLANVYRNRDSDKVRLRGVKGEVEGKAADRLVLYVVSERKVRPDRREGDVYEVEYGISENADTGICYLGRRCGSVEDESTGNQRGMMTRTAEHLGELQFEYFNGRQWQRQWQQISVVPELVRVRLTLVDPEGRWPAVVLSQEVAPAPAEQPLLEAETETKGRDGTDTKKKEP